MRRPSPGPVVSLRLFCRARVIASPACLWGCTHRRSCRARSFSPGLGISSLIWTVLMSRLRPPLMSRWVAKSASADLAMTLPCTAGAAGHHDAQAVAQLHRVGLGFRQRRVHPGLGQVHDGHDRLPAPDHFALPRAPTDSLSRSPAQTPWHSRVRRRPGRIRPCAFCTWSAGRSHGARRNAPSAVHGPAPAAARLRPPPHSPWRFRPRLRRPASW